MLDNRRRGGDGQRQASGAMDNTTRGGGAGTTRDKQVADDVSRVTRGDPAADDTTRGWGWRTCDDTEGGGNGNDDGDEEQSLQWQQK